MHSSKSKSIYEKHNLGVTSVSGAGKYRITAEVRFIGEDILASVWGGTKPHIGSVAVAESRPSLHDAQCISVTSSVINFPGHKDDVVSKMFAERISSAMNCRCITTAGIHVDNASNREVSKLLRNCETLCSRMVTILRGRR